MKKKKLLVVDDDPIFQFGMEILIGKLTTPVNLTAMTRGQDVLDYMSNAKETDIPDVIFLDLNMPVMDGWETLEELTKIRVGKKLTIYICSSSINPEDIKRAKNLSAVSDYIIKPIVKEDIERILNTAA